MLGILALLSCFVVVDGYFGHTINAFYFPTQSHGKDFIPIVVFAGLFLALLWEIVGLGFFKHVTRTGVKSRR